MSSAKRKRLGRHREKNQSAAEWANDVTLSTHVETASGPNGVWNPNFRNSGARVAQTSAIGILPTTFADLVPISTPPVHLVPASTPVFVCFNFVHRFNRMTTCVLLCIVVCCFICVVFH